ncbi:MAG: M23 family metallopeptidase [Chloroflexota bacterium]
MIRRFLFFPPSFLAFLLLFCGLGCGLITAVENPASLSGVAYWAAATGTAVPTETRFLGTTTPVYASTPIPAEVTLPPQWLTTTPAWTTVTPVFVGTPTPYWVTTTPGWVTTTPIYITETPLSPVTTTPGLPIIGFTTPVPQQTPYYRVGSFYMHSDVYIGGAQGVILRLTAWETTVNPRQSGASFYYVTFQMTNNTSSEIVIPLSDLVFIRYSDTGTQVVSGRWQPGNEALLVAGLPLADGQLATPLPPGTAQVVTLGITVPTGAVEAIGVLTNWQQIDAQPIWFLLQEDPTGPYQDALQPPPPTPILLGSGGGSEPGTPGAPGGRIWPTTGQVLRGFGCHEEYTGIDGAGYGCPAEQPWFHNGVDIANTLGTLVRSPIDGTMLYAGPNSGGADCATLPGSQPPHEGLGNYQRIGDGTTLHYLGHLHSFLVTGGAVMVAQNVAEMGSTGCSTGTHLHWMVYENGNLVDPAVWVGQ